MIPSKMMGSGFSGGQTKGVCGTANKAITAAGTNQGTATQLSDDINIIGTAGASTGVILPPCELGASVFVYNAGANTVNVFPYSGGKINGGTTDAAVTLATTKGAQFIGVSNTEWYELPGA